MAFAQARKNPAKKKVFPRVPHRWIAKLYGTVSSTRIRVAFARSQQQPIHVAGPQPSQNMNIQSLLCILLLTPLFAEPVHPPITFTVCDQPLATKPLPAEAALRILAHDPHQTLEAHSPAPQQEWLSAPSQDHPFLRAAHLAFADHRPLAISPDMIWLLLTQSAAAEVIKQPGTYREFFANHQFGKRTLSIRRDNLIPGSPHNDWPSVFQEFESTILAHTSNSPAATFSHIFTSSTPAEISARSLTLLAAASPYYVFRVNTLCGIPRFELHGTTSDWRWIRDNVSQLRKLGLKRRTDALLPVLDEFINASNNKPNPAFWRSFYKYSSESGSSYISGWINLFFIEEHEKMLDEILKPGFQWSAAPVTRTKLGAQNLPLALRSRDEKPSGCQQIDFTWETPDGAQRPMLIRAGFLGIAQDPHTLTLTPAIGWQVWKTDISPEDRAAFHFLAAITHGNDNPFHGSFSLMRRNIIFDPKTKRITYAPGSNSDSFPHEFWIKVLPKMANLQSLDISIPLESTDNLEEQKAICTAALAAPSVKSIIASDDIPQECLKILQDRKDWKIDAN